MGWLAVLTCRHSSVMRSPPARGFRSLHCMSAGHRLCSRRMTLSRRGRWSKGFGWDSSFVRCLILLAWMTSCTGGIPKSVWIIELVTYQRGVNSCSLYFWQTPLYDRNSFIFNCLKTKIGLNYIWRFHSHRAVNFSVTKTNQLTLRRLMSYIYGAPILDVSRSHTTTQHSR